MYQTRGGNPGRLFHFLQSVDEFFFKKGVGQGNQGPTGYHHHVHSSGAGLLVSSKYFPDFALGPVSDHGIPDFFGNDHAQSFVILTVGQIKKSA